MHWPCVLGDSRACGASSVSTVKVNVGNVLFSAFQNVKSSQRGGSNWRENCTGDSGGFIKIQLGIYLEKKIDTRLHKACRKRKQRQNMHVPGFYNSTIHRSAVSQILIVSELTLGLCSLCGTCTPRCTMQQWPLFLPPKRMSQWPHSAKGELHFFWDKDIYVLAFLEKHELNPSASEISPNMKLSVTSSAWCLLLRETLLDYEGPPKLTWAGSLPVTERWEQRRAQLLAWRLFCNLENVVSASCSAGALLGNLRYSSLSLCCP